MARAVVRADTIPFGWVEISDAALQRLRRELEQKGQGVVDEMGVLSIHGGYANYFFSGTSILQSRPRYLFFVCWNFLWLAGQRGVVAANLRKRKDEADLWVTSQLVATERRIGAPGSTVATRLDMSGIIGARLFEEDPPRLPVQSIDFIYWTALRRWGFYRSRIAPDRARLFRRWRGAGIQRVGDGVDDGRDDTVRDDPLAELLVPSPPSGWRSEESEGLDFELTPAEARWLQERLLALDEVTEGPCLLAKAAELCTELPPRMEAEEGTDLSPWADPVVIHAARAAGQTNRLERAMQASMLAHYVRSIYGALVERVVEATASPRRDPPERYYRQLFGQLAGDRAMRDDVLALSLPDLYLDVPRIPDLLRRVLGHIQDGLRRVAAGANAEQVFMDDVTHRLFEAVERRRKGARARLPLTEQGAARRVGFERGTVRVYGLDYRWSTVRYLLSDLHRGLGRE